MKTEPIPVIVTEPGKGKAVNPYSGDHNAVGREYEFNRNNHIRDCIDTKGNALPVGQYLCREIKQYRVYGIANNYWTSTKPESHSHIHGERTVYELIDDEVKGEKAFIPVNMGVANGIDPCPFCAGKEGETVFLGYNEPRYMISCTNCNVRLIDDRKDKVQAKWNLRNGITFWDKQSWLKEHSTPIDEAKEVESLEQAADKYANSVKPNDKGEYYHHMAIDNAFIAGANYRAAHPIENKEGVKSARVLNDIISNADQIIEIVYDKDSLIHDLAEDIKGEAKSLISPIEQGKRMVDVEEVIEVIKNHPYGIHGQKSLMKKDRGANKSTI